MDKMSKTEFDAAIEKAARSFMRSVQADAKKPVRTSRKDRGCMLIGGGHRTEGTIGGPNAELEYDPYVQVWYLHYGPYNRRQTAQGAAANVRARLVEVLAAWNADALDG